MMVWQPTMRIWAGDEVKIDEKELESDAMEGIIENAGAGGANSKGKSTGSSGSQSMSVSAASVSGDD